jgi:tetratricopeptide (TPR) repeat protein
MKTNNPVNETEPSHIVVDQILERSEHCNSIIDTAISLKEKVEHTQDEETLLKLNNELQLQMKRMSKLKEYTGDIHETFRTVPRMSKRLQQAKDCFYQGKFPEMDEVLDASKIRGNVESLTEDSFSEDEERKKKARARLECKSYELIVKALYHCTLIENPEWYEDVYDFLTDAYDMSFNVHAMYELAAYLRLTEDQDWAQELLDDAYVVSRDTEGEAWRLYEAKSLWAMGTIAKGKQDYPKAVEYAGKALKIYTGLSEKNPAEYRPRMSDMLMVMGDYHTFARNFTVALVVFEEAMNIRRELALHGSREYTLQLSDTLDKLATVHLCLGEFQEGFARYEEALKIREDNLDYNLYMMLEAKANTLYNLSVGLYSAKEYGGAIRRAKEELETRKRLQEVDPFGQLPYMAKIRSLLADAYLNLQQPENAIREREMEVKLYRTFAKRFPDRLRDLGEALNHCSNLYFRMKAYGKYFLMMKEALEIFRKLAVTSPDEYLPTVGCLLSNVCHYYKKISPDRKKALEAAREAVRILSSIERDEAFEVAYEAVQRVIEEDS